MDEITATKYRAEFPVTQNWTYFDHAAVAPISQRAHDRIREWSDDLLQNGDVHEGSWFAQVEKIREQAAALIAAKPSEIAFLKNTSEGIAMVAEGFPWKEGDNVLLIEGEYPANIYPWLHLKSRGVESRIVPCVDSRIVIDKLAAAIDHRTRMISVSFVQFASGFRADLAAIAQLCRDHDLDLCVDAIQGLGVFPLDVEKLGIDYLAADGHKWLVGPEGAAIVYVRESKIDKLRAPSIGWKSVVHFLDFSNIDYRLRPEAARFEGGSYQMPCILGLGGSLEIFHEVGVANIEQRVGQLTHHLVEGLQRDGANLVSPRGDGEWSGIVSFTMPGQETADLVKRCKQERVILSNRAGRLRASPHFYNTQAEIDHLLTLLKPKR